MTVLDLGAKASYAEDAVRAVNEKVEQYAALYRSTCRAYKDAALSKEEYVRRLDSINQWMMGLKETAAVVSGADNVQTVKEALTAAYDRLPPTDRDPLNRLDLAFRLRMAGQQVVLAPGAPLPTGAQTSVELRLTQQSYVYLFQKKPSGQIAVLFPDPRIGVNPIPPNKTVEIPPESVGSYVVDNNDEGQEERLFVVVSPKRIDSLESALPSAQNVKDDPTLAQLAQVPPGALPPTCTAATRALEFRPKSAEGTECPRSRGLAFAPAAGKSLVASATPGDDTIVKVIPFLHVKQEDYQRALAAPEKRTRGIMME